MKCAVCGCEQWKVISKRDSCDIVRRRRECKSCGNRITTYEVDVEELKAPKTKLIRAILKKVVIDLLREIEEKRWLE